MKTLKSNLSIFGSELVGMHTFANNHEVPIYDVKDVGALNQFIGYSKYANSDYGNVYYRGMSNLYPTMLPALMRNRTCGAAEDLIRVIHRVESDSFMSASLSLTPQIEEHGERNKKLNKQIRKYNGFLIEAVMQHYNGNTRFLDLVDNHWVALWMGLHKFTKYGDSLNHYKCERRNFSALDLIESNMNTENASADSHNPYLYIAMIAIPYMDYVKRGVREGKDFVEVDLRSALPSTYLRPHAQHALVVRRRVGNNTENCAEYFDMANQATGILRIRIDRANQWLGEGVLMSVSNMFPSPAIDTGYNTLLLNSNLFYHNFRIMKYF